MPRRSRTEKRILKDQDTVGMQRAERKEQEELAGKKKREAAQAKALQLALTKEKEAELGVKPERIARAGKPLKRAR